MKKLKTKKAKKAILNRIEVGNMSVMSENADIKELLTVADKILTKHKDLISKNKPDQSRSHMFG